MRCNDDIKESKAKAQKITFLFSLLLNVFLERKKESNKNGVVVKETLHDS